MLTTVDETGVDKTVVDKTGVDDLGCYQKGHFHYCTLMHLAVFHEAFWATI